MTPRQRKIALLSDIHGNSPALCAVLEDVRRQGCDRLLMLGDVCPGVDPQGCLNLLRAWETTYQEQTTCLRGNAEAYILTPDLDRLPAEKDEERTEFASLLALIRWLQAQIAPADLARLHTWPDSIRWDGVCLVHDSPFDRFFQHEWRRPGLPEQYQEWYHHSRGLHPEMDSALLARLQAWMEAEELSYLFCGHTHVPFNQQIGSGVVCNVGSVGLPLDADPRPAWVLWQPDLPGAAGLSIRRVDYQVSLVQNMIAETPGYLAWDRPGKRQAHLKMFATGLHWRVHLAAQEA